jgi:hypothetical protein
MNAVTQHFFASSETVSTASPDLFAGFRWLLAPLPQAPEERAFAWTVRQLDPDEGRQARSIRAAKQPRRA